MRYLDFDLEISPGTGRSYPLVVRSEAGATHVTMQFLYDELALKDTLKDLRIALLQSSQTRRALTDEEQAVQEFGQRLFEALFAGVAGSLFYESRSKAAQEGLLGVRVRLNVQAPELAGLPWEYLYDPRAGEYLCLSQTTPVVRYLELAAPLQPLLVTPPLRILGMIASPSDQAPLDITRETGRLEEALEPLQRTGQVELTWLAGQTWEDLQAAMWQGPWHIFHFIGHGGYDRRADEGVLALCDEAGQTHLLFARELARLLTNHRALRLVVLNACEGAKGSSRDLFSSTAGALARRGIPAILAMQEQITDDAAIQLTRTFYRALAAGLPVDAAVAEARTAISVKHHHSLEWGTPVLYLRAPESTLFHLGNQPIPAPVPPSAPETAKREPVAPPTTPARGTPAQAEPATPMTSVAHPAPPPPVLAESGQPQALPLRVGTLRLRLTGPTRAVRSVAWSPDGRRLATASADHTVRLWDSTSGTLLATLEGHTNVVNAVAWSPDGYRLASASGDQTVRLWDAERLQPLAILSGHTNAVNAVAWSPDGRRLASASGIAERHETDHTVRLWDGASGQSLAILADHTHFVNAVAWSPDGRRLASASGDQTVRLWDGTSGQLRATIQGHKGGVQSVAWSPDGRRLASASVDQTVCLWDVETHRRLTVLKGHTSVVRAVAWSPDGRRLATASGPGLTFAFTSDADQTVRLWDSVSGQLLTTLEGPLGGVLAVAWSSDGHRLASAGFSSLRETQSFSRPRFPSGSLSQSEGKDDTVRVWWVGTGEVPGTPRL